MKKTLITAAAVFALVMSGGASMAAPLGDHGFGRAHDVRSNVSQVFDHQNSNMSDRSFELSSKQSLGGRNLATSQQTDLYGS